MKKLIITLAMSCMLLTLSATDYKFLTLESVDGSLRSVSAIGLTLTFSDGNLVASDGTVIPLSNLSKMYFTETSGISETTTIKSGYISVYSLTGMSMGTFSSTSAMTSALPAGIYIIKDQEGNTRKTTIR